MANVLVEESCLQNIADEIRSYTGSSDTYKPSEFAPQISSVFAAGQKDATASPSLSTVEITIMCDWDAGNTSAETGSVTVEYINTSCQATTVTVNLGEANIVTALKGSPISVSASNADYSITGTSYAWSGVEIISGNSVVVRALI